jgi:SAM-dependent methyltransferase
MGMIWAKMKLTAPSLLGGRFKMFPIAAASPKLKHAIEQPGPALRSYERLAAIYHEYAQSFCPNYAAFLQALAKKYQIELPSVLDLACGAGTITQQLAPLAGVVVGIDSSSEMLAAATELCKPLGNVRFMHVDFRNFEIGQRFDAVVCGSDSLNYVTEPAELVRVFECVARHLTPRGLFVCDALDDRGMRHYSGKFIPIQLNGTECGIVLRYDPAQRVENAIVVFPSGVESHRRVPIEPHDVIAAARTTGLTVLDWFSIAGFGLFQSGGIRNFYVLQRSPAAHRVVGQSEPE